LIRAHAASLQPGTAASNPARVCQEATKFTAMSGKAMGVEHAVLFRAHDLQAPPEFFTEAMQD
jgi:hypothetical protein